jgi:hypothetical protein
MPLNGRRGQVAHNGEIIPTSARTVFAADPGGSHIGRAAGRAGAGISALWRRCASREDLLS